MQWWMHNRSIIRLGYCSNVLLNVHLKAVNWTDDHIWMLSWMHNQCVIRHWSCLNLLLNTVSKLYIDHVTISECRDECTPNALFALGVAWSYFWMFISQLYIGHVTIFECRVECTTNALFVLGVAWTRCWISFHSCTLTIWSYLNIELNA